MQKLGWWSVSISYTEGAALAHIKSQGISIEEYAKRCAERFTRDTSPPEWQVRALEQGIARDLRAYAEKHNIIVVA